MSVTFGSSSSASAVPRCGSGQRPSPQFRAPHRASNGPASHRRGSRCVLPRSVRLPPGHQKVTDRQVGLVPQERTGLVYFERLRHHNPWFSLADDCAAGQGFAGKAPCWLMVRVGQRRVKALRQRRIYLSAKPQSTQAITSRRRYGARLSASEEVKPSQMSYWSKEPVGADRRRVATETGCRQPELRAREPRRVSAALRVTASRSRYHLPYGAHPDATTPFQAPLGSNYRRRASDPGRAGRRDRCGGDGRRCRIGGGGDRSRRQSRT